MQPSPMAQVARASYSGWLQPLTSNNTHLSIVSTEALAAAMALIGLESAHSQHWRTLEIDCFAAVTVDRG